MATEQEYRSILIPNQPFRRLKIADYISQGKKKKRLFGCFCGLLPNTRQVNNPR